MADQEQTVESSKPLGDIFSSSETADSVGREESPTPAEAVEEPKPTDAPATEEDKKPTEEAKVDDEQPVKEVEAEAKPEGEQPPEKEKAVGDTKPAIDWDNDENPYRKQARDTRNWATQVNAQNAKLHQQLDVINKKLDGTYDPITDDPKPDPQAVILQAQAEGKMLGSLDAAYSQYGKGDKKAGQVFVDREIERYNELFAENPSVQNQVWSSPAPVFAALKMVRDFDVSQKWETSDVGELIEKVRSATKSEFEKELTEKITKQVMDGIAMKNRAPAGINGARAATKIDGEKPPIEKPLASLFTN